MPDTITLDAKALAIGKFSSVLAIDERALGATMAVQPVEAAPRISSNVAVMSIRGALAQRAVWCFDGYDMIARRFAETIGNAAVDAVLLDVDSPGGDAAGMAECVRAMQAARDASGKPVVMWAGETAASAAYALSMVATEHYLPPSGEVGSVGCLCIHEDISKMLEDEGVKLTIVRSGARKAEHNPYEPLTDEARASLQECVDEHAAQFAAIVAGARGGKPEKYLALNGAMFMGEQAASAGLATKVMTFDAVLARAAALGKKWRKGQTMKTINAKLGLPETATEAETLAAIDRIDGERLSLVKATGKATTAEAIGEIEAGKANKAALEKANAELATERAKLADLERKSEAAEVAKLIDAAAAERKIVPANRAKVEQFAATHGKAATLALLESLVPVAPAAEAKEPAHDAKGGESAGTGAAPAPFAKPWEQMSGAEKHDLYHGNRASYDAAKADWIKRGKPAK